MWIVQGSVRGVAARLGVAPNTAQRALAALRKAGLINAMQERERGGRFGGTVYRLTVDQSVLVRHTRHALGVNTPMIAPQPRVASKPVVALGQQLVLLPSV
jgi:DNA-binding transcriptional ArsR family regulator